MTFSVFDAVTMPRLEELRAALVRAPLDLTRDRTPEDWLDTLYCDHPAGLVALHSAFVDFLWAESAAEAYDNLNFRDWVWLLAHRLYWPDGAQKPGGEAVEP